MAKKSKSVNVIDGPEPADRRKWEVEDALRTLTRAEEIKKDPALMRDVRAKAREQAEEMSDIASSLTKGGLISKSAMDKVKARRGRDND